jgi:hypothetical protein
MRLFSPNYIVAQWIKHEEIWVSLRSGTLQHAGNGGIEGRVVHTEVSKVTAGATILASQPLEDRLD